MNNNTTNNEMYLYILMRTDIPSQAAGRAAAQASHATSVLEHEFKDHKDLKTWKSQTQYGYGTCIVLGATLTEITDIFSTLTGSKYCMGWTIDPDYVIPISTEIENFIDTKILKSVGASVEYVDGNPPRLFLHRREKTCAYILGPKEDLKSYLGNLPLYAS